MASNMLKKLLDSLIGWAAFFSFCLSGIFFCSVPSAWTVQQEPGSWKIDLRCSIGAPNRAQTGTIKNVLMLNDGRSALACGLDGTVCLWDLDKAEIIRRFVDVEFTSVFCMGLVNDGRQVLAAGSGPGVVLWDLETGEQIKRFKHSATIYCLSVFDDQKSFVCGDANGNVLHFQLDDDEPLTRYRDSSDEITALTVTPGQDGFVAGNDEGKVAMWELDHERPSAKFRGLSSWACCLRFSDEGDELFGCDYDGNIVLWNVDDRKAVWKKESLAGEICWGHFVDDESLVVVDTDDSFYLIDRKTGRASKKSVVIPEASGFDLSPDKSILWCGGTNLVCGWDIGSAGRVFPSDEAMNFVSGIQSLVARGDLVFVATSKPAVEVWNLKTGLRQYVIDFKKSLSVNWDGLRLLPQESGLVVCCDEGLIVVDYLTGDILFAKKLANNGLVDSMRPGFLTYTDRQNTRLREIDLKSGRQKTLFEVSDAPNISQFVFLDERTVVMIVEQYPERMQIVSLGERKVVEERIFEDGFDLKISSRGLLIGLNHESELIVFNSPHPEKGPLDEALIEQLVKELDSGEYALRDRATRRLAFGGEAVINVLDRTEPDSLEKRVRFARIRQLMSTSMVPNLGKPLRSGLNPDEEIETVCVDPNGEYFLLTVRDGWKSRLLVCSIHQESWTVDSRIPLRSRASTIVAVAQSRNAFAIGYRDGTLDIVQLKRF